MNALILKTGQSGHQLGAPSFERVFLDSTERKETGRENRGGERGLSEEDAFIAYLQARGTRPRQIKSLRQRVRRFQRWLESGGIGMGDIDRRVARSYQQELFAYVSEKGGEYSPRTVCAYRYAASLWCRFLEESGRIQANPFRVLRMPRTPKTVLSGVLKEAEMEKVLDSFTRWDEAGVSVKRRARRYLAHVVAELQYASGLRIAEVAALKVNDIDLERRLIIVREGKWGRDRIAYLSEYAAGILSIYIRRMRPLVLDGHHRGNPDSLFGCGHEALSHCQNAQLAEVASSLGCKLTSHGFRHALGYHLLRAGCPLRQIQEILGHRNIKDTEAYTKVDVSSVQAVLDQLHPRGARQLGHAP